MQATCCNDAKGLTAGNGPLSCWKLLEDGWGIPGCCGGGCYVQQGLRFCPFCGQPLPGVAPPEAAGLRNFTVTVQLAYAETGQSPADCWIGCHPDGGTPLAVVLQAVVAVGVYALGCTAAAGLDRDDAAALIIADILRGRAKKVEDGQACSSN